ncbi:CshA/CshB family fibrillar adhesin-related protein [Arthrobacter sp. E3]|uniref:CshA/CshB family fibrillar adhesin-related protein n=1 Tax=Arthrobacter sp. E3 TaxID=517402 RepID=UPI001A94C3E3|nr:CshA/CshB family fibrillar adhesin-related protein [Arthrobacter sp. E3]
MLKHEPSWGEVRQRSLLRNSLHAVVLALCTVLVFSGLSLSTAGGARAAFAPDGAGLYKGTIDWMEWGTPGESIPAAGKTTTSTRTIGGQALTSTCTLTGLSGEVEAYRSGTWHGDDLDDLYNKGGTGLDNQMVYGLSNHLDGRLVGFNVACNATLDGVAVPLGGLVIADAESSGSTEYISAKPNDQNAQWRIIERYRSPGCTTNLDAKLTTDKQLTLQPTAAECPSGPMAVAYMQGAKAASISLKGAGKSAVAIGVVLQADFGDAPTNYLSAGALFTPTWSANTLNNQETLKPGTTTKVFDPTFTLSTPGQPIPRLGALTDSDGTHQFSDNADLDDLTGADDEDAIQPPATPLRVAPGDPYTLNNVACTGPGFVAGWIDWNLNGAFDTGEKSAVVQCTGTKVNLVWTVPADVKNTPGQTTSFLRLRIATDAAGVASPIGMSTSGEVEDHPVRISTSNLSLQKNIKARVAPTDQFTLSVTAADFIRQSVSTTGSTTEIQEKMIGPFTTTKNKIYTLKEVATGSPLTPLSEYDTSIQCTGTYADGSLAPVTAAVLGVQGEATITMPDPSPTLGAQSIVCTFINTPKPATLSVTASWVVNGTTYANGAQPAGIQAQLTLAGANQAWNTPKSGYAAGQKVAISESMSIAAAMPGCTLEKARVTSLNGAGTDVALSSYVQTLKAGANTATVTNTVTCTTNLTLVKEVVGGTVQPNAWTLAGYPSSGSAVVQGTTGVTAKVTAGVSLQLGESGGSALYVQDDSRTPEERTQAPRSTGSWACSAVDGLKNPVAGVVTGRMGTNGTITPALGSNTTCTATNRTAELTILKKVENVNGTGTGEPKDWNLTATPASGIPGLLPTTKQGSKLKSPVNTFNVRPGQGYLLSEDRTLGGYVQVGLERFTGSDPTLASEIESDANWTSVPAATAITVDAGKNAVYRFVNRDAKRFDLPLTGGSGTTGFLLVGGFAASLSLGAVLFISLRRRASKKLP